MAGGPITPSGGPNFNNANGLLYPAFYAPSTASNYAANSVEGVGCVASLSSGSTANAWMCFNLPETIPSGVAKLRVLSLANASTGKLFFTPSDAVFAAGTVPTSTSMIAGTQSTVAWSTASNGPDFTIETKIALQSTMVANSLLFVEMAFNSTGAFTLAAASVHQTTVVWE